MKDFTDPMTKTPTMTMLMATTGLRPTASERAMGRFMRAPDGHDGGDDGAGAGGGEAASGDGQAGKAAAGAEGDGAGAEGGAAGATGGAEDGDGEGAAASLMNREGDQDGDGDQGGEGDNDADADPVPEGDYELSLPEGTEMDTELLGEAAPILKEVGLGNKKASQLVPLVEKIQAKTIAAVQQQAVDSHQAMVADWAKETLADPEVGGKNLKASQEHVARALDRFVGPKFLTDDKGEKIIDPETKQPKMHPFRQLLDDTGIGSNPHLFKAFAAIGAAIGEDNQLPRGAGGSQAEKSRAERLYGDQAKPKGE